MYPQQKVPTNTPTPASGYNPNALITNFSDCHVDIVAHLDSLGELPALLAPAERAREIAADTLALFERKSSRPSPDIARAVILKTRTLPAATRTLGIA